MPGGLRKWGSLHSALHETENRLVPTDCSNTFDTVKGCARGGGQLGADARICSGQALRRETLLWCVLSLSQVDSGEASDGVPAIFQRGTARGSDGTGDVLFVVATMLLTYFRAEFKAARAGGGGVEAMAYIDGVTPGVVRSHDKHGQRHAFPAARA